ncbi:MAG: hypothetical protein ACLQGP_15815 [Isosphaeraceae bacterium]
MAIIAGISPASICDEEDLIVAVEMILIDMLRGIASSEGRCGNTLDFIVHRSGDVAAQRYEIRVESAESASERRRARGKWIAGLEARALLADDDQGEDDECLTGDERKLLAAYRVLDIPFGEALRRLENEPLDEAAVELQAKASGRCCELGEGCRFGIRRLLGLT